MVPIVTVFLVICEVSAISGDRISARAILLSPQAPDMKDTYGLVPLFSIGGNLSVDQNKSFFFSLNGVHENGSFHYDARYYGSGNYDTRLRAFWTVVGGRLRSFEQDRSISFGAGIILAWAGEGLPETNSSGSIYLRDRTGTSMGVLLNSEFEFFIRPRLSIGFEGRFQALSIRIKYKPDGSHWQYYNLDLSGLGLGPYLAYYLR